MTARIKSKPGRVLILEALCPECAYTMEYDGIWLMSDPPQYPHTCKCGYKEI